jgi:hypothetical protein
MDPPLDPLPEEAGHRVACHFPDEGPGLASMAGTSMVVPTPDPGPAAAPAPSGPPVAPA